MDFDSELSLIPCIFKARINRFTILGSVKGQPVLAFLANPGRLGEILLPGRKLYLKPSSRGRLPYMVIAADMQGMPLLLQTHLTNFYVEQWLSHRLIPGFENYSLVKKEIKFMSSRFDFLLQSLSKFMVLEVKTCTLFAHHLAFFPDAVSERGQRHLLELATLAEQPGWEAAVLFVVWWPQALYFLPEFHTDWKFASTMLEIKNKINFVALAVGLNNRLEPNPNFIRQLNIPWALIEQEAVDRGAYLLIIQIENNLTIYIKNIGKVDFKPGYYLYVGSALRNLNSRLNRHQRRRKKLFWHIDYLLQEAKLILTLPIRTLDDLECDIAHQLTHIATPVPNFGSSDCSCLSHLFFLPSDPRHFPPFIELLHKFRYHRLESKLF